jgi:hypothetical protein
MAEALQDPLLKQAESPDFNVEAEVKGAVAQLVADRRASRHQELLVRVQEGTATPAEQAEYNDLWTQISAAKSGNPSPEERSKL